MTTLNKSSHLYKSQLPKQVGDWEDISSSDDQSGIEVCLYLVCYGGFIFNNHNGTTGYGNHSALFILYFPITEGYPFTHFLNEPFTNEVLSTGRGEVMHIPSELSCRSGLE